tara:strand:- start:96326 stop:96970 length:645 start_codon:yes stop_codon:yes gene_type:complete
MTKLFILLSLISFYSEAKGHFKYLKGNVSIIRNGKTFKVIKKNNQIIEKDLIRVGQDSLAIVKINERVTIKVEANSQLLVENPKSQKNETSLLMQTGAVFVDFLNKDKKAKLNFKTRQAVMGIRGTRFFVSYGRNDKDTWMCVESGVVEVKDRSGKKVSVKKGEGVKLDSKKVSKPQYLPWTAKLNWNLDPKKNLENKVKIEEAYNDPLDQEYD